MSHDIVCMLKSLSNYHVLFVLLFEAKLLVVYGSITPVSNFGVITRSLSCFIFAHKGMTFFFSNAGLYTSCNLTGNIQYRSSQTAFLPFFFAKWK